MTKASVHSGRTDSGVPFQFELLPGSVSFDAYDHNVDVQLVVNGKRYFPTVFTLVNIETLMSRHEQTGECGSGAYFMAADMVIVRRLSLEALESAFAALIEEGDLDRISCEES